MKTICEESAVQTLIAEIADGCYLAEYTDKLLIGKASDVLPDAAKLLDLRAWNRSCELHLYREYTGMPFACRTIDDTQNGAMEHFDEVQILDIDAKRSNGVDKVTTGGGKYRLPAAYADCDRIRVRSYIEYDENNLAVVWDWRIVGFEKGSAANGN